jgi:hypothetical protein
MRAKIEFLKIEINYNYSKSMLKDIIIYKDTFGDLFEMVFRFRLEVT